MKNRALLPCLLASVVVFTLATAPLTVTGAFQSKESNSFVYPKGYSKLSKKRVDQLRKIHYVFETICSGSYTPAFARDEIIEAFEKMCMSGAMNGAHFVFIANWSIDQVIVDPIERAHAKEAIKRAIDKFRPLDDQLNS